MIAIAALHDKRLYLSVGTSSQDDWDDMPIYEPHVDMPPMESARRAEPPKAKTSADDRPDAQMPESAANPTPRPEPVLRKADAAPASNRKMSMRAVFDQLEHDHQAA